MSAWIVYSKDGQTERCKLKKLEYSGSFMNERTVTATFEYHSEVAFEVFDYIVYRGEKFELEAIPSVKKASSMDYQYELRFVSLKYELERCEMRDIVPNDNGITYPTPLTFSFTGDVRYLTERIQVNLDALYGQGVWSIIVSDDVESEEKNITIAQQNCWNALSLVNTTYGLNFSIKGRIITIGGSQSTIGHTFQYGKGNGLYEIERNSDTDTGIVTKLRAYGSTRNLDYSYPKKPEWTDSVLPVSFILSPLRLMLPSFKKDGKTDYILADEATISEYGIREASVIYDDIYPSITGATNSSGVPIDEIKSVEPIDDSASTFVVYLHDLEFDLESHLTTDNAQISMKSGAMQGYTFNISEIERISNNFYKITLGRITTDQSDTGNYNIPNSSWHMEAGDKFVFLNILMPQKYIRDAEERLLERAQEYLAEYGKTNFSYNVGLHDKFLKEHEAVYNELIEGAKLSVYDSELGISENVTVQSITITEYADDNILPQVKVTLNNKPSASTLERIQGQIKELSETSAGQFSTQSELLKQYRRKLDKPFFDRLFAAVDFDGNEIPSTDMTTPIAYIKARFNFATLGGVTMYLDDKSLNLPSIYDGLPIDHDTIYWENGVLKAKGGGGGGTGGVDESAVRTLIESYDYATKDFVRDYVLQNATGSEFELSKQMVIDALGFTPYSAENPNGYITAASIPSALKNPYALTFGSKSYDGSSAKEITASDLGAALSSDLSKYLPLTGGTISGQTAYPLTINSKSGGSVASYIQFSHKNVVKSAVGYWGNRTTIQDAESSSYLAINSDGAFYNTNKIWHEGNFNPANYLPLSGGTISGKLRITYSDYDDILTIQRIHPSGNSIIKYSNKTEFLGHIGVYGSAGTFPYHPMFADKDGNQYKLWHSGNDGSGSGLDADTLDGVHASKLYKVNSAVDLGGTTSNYDTLIVKYSNTSATSNHPYSIVGGNQCVALNLYAGTDYAAQLAVGFGTNYLAYRRKVGSTSWQSWVKINAGLADEATKLQTARTIWGQSFDGSWDVSGDLNGVGRIIRTEPTAVDMDFAGNFIFKNLNSVASNYWHIDTADGTPIFVVHNNGNVGIGTTSPTKKLHIKATSDTPIYIEHNSSNSWPSALHAFNTSLVPGQHYSINLGYQHSSRNSAWFGYYHAGDGSTSNRLCMGLHSVDDVINILGSGNVGIGTPDPSAKLHVVGNILATGGVTMQSARILKNVVDERGLSLTELSAIKPTRYTWKDKRDDRIHIGGIADDIEKVLPEVIYKTSDGTLTMDYGNAGFAIASSLIKPVVDHEEHIIDHEERIKALERENKELKEQIEQFKCA